MTRLGGRAPPLGLDHFGQTRQLGHVLAERAASAVGRCAGRVVSGAAAPTAPGVCRGEPTVPSGEPRGASRGMPPRKLRRPGNRRYLTTRKLRHRESWLYIWFRRHLTILCALRGHGAGVPIDRRRSAPGGPYHARIWTALTMTGSAPAVIRTQHRNQRGVRKLQKAVRLLNTPADREREAAFCAAGSAPGPPCARYTD